MAESSVADLTAKSEQCLSLVFLAWAVAAAFEIFHHDHMTYVLYMFRFLLSLIDPDHLFGMRTARRNADFSVRGALEESSHEPCTVFAHLFIVLG